MKEIKVGCCGFPKARKEYYQTFKLVEVQQTFYQPPTLKTAEKWRVEAPSDFEFTLKAWQLITHESRSPTYRRLKLSWPQGRLDHCGSFKPTEEVYWAWERTREIAHALKSQYIVFQCPASFQPSAESKENLKRFFEKADRRGVQFIWEPRGSWGAKEIKELCQELDLIHAVDPFKNEPEFGGIRYFRLHGITGYRYRFGDKDLRVLHEKCRGITYCLFNNLTMWVDGLALAELNQKD
jgi:uncharacterized protein YecE (DUF72 family)